MSLFAERPNLGTLLERALATGGETDGFDFKEQLDYRGNGEHKLRLLKAIGAFCNTDNGGHSIIGVSDDRRVVGISPALAETYDQTPVQRLVAEYFAPPPTIQVRQHERDGKKLVIVEVAPFATSPASSGSTSSRAERSSKTERSSRETPPPNQRCSPARSRSGSCATPSQQGVHALSSS